MYNFSQFFFFSVLYIFVKAKCSVRFNFFLVTSSKLIKAASFIGWTGNTAAFRRKSLREPGVSRHHGGLIEFIMKVLGASQHYRIVGFKRSSEMSFHYAEKCYKIYPKINLLKLVIVNRIEIQHISTCVFVLSKEKDSGRYPCQKKRIAGVILVKTNLLNCVKFHACNC